ncbi:hypothetical protein QCA50_010990 [Cerrena zonata]|uniref:Uncharacterized protein n=1 Tax=Cerrena zonata TaxID=2478898 RepID=A0AAW0FXV1_9APHY
MAVLLWRQCINPPRLYAEALKCSVERPSSLTSKTRQITASLFASPRTMHLMLETYLEGFPRVGVFNAFPQESWEGLRGGLIDHTVCWYDKRTLERRKRIQASPQHLDLDEEKEDAEAAFRLTQVVMDEASRGGTTRIT